jgi:hypothetical protein
VSPGRRSATKNLNEESNYVQANEIVEHRRGVLRCAASPQHRWRRNK